MQLFASLKCLSIAPKIFLSTFFMEGSVAEWSKALVLGTSQKWRGFESHRCQNFCNDKDMNNKNKILMEMRGIEPLASRMRIERSTTELHPHRLALVVCLIRDTIMRARLAEWSKA